MEEVLEFRQRRMAELQSLRAAMDEFCLQVLNSPDRLRTEADVVSRVDRALADIEKVMNESRLARIYSSLKTNLSSPTFMRDAVVGAGFGLLTGGGSIPLVLLNSALGTAVCSLAASVESSLKPIEIPDELTAYSYLYHVQSELGP